MPDIIEWIMVGALAGLCSIIAGICIYEKATGKKINQPKHEPGYVYELNLRTEDINRNDHIEKVLTIEGTDYHVVKTPEGNYKLMPFKIESTTKDGKILHQIIDETKQISPYKN